MRRRIVVGGGIAGLTTAVLLAQRNVPVTIFEARPSAGGRAWSFPELPGVELDNGQHLLMGCYSSTLSLLQRLGTADLLTPIRPMRIPFIHADGRRGVLAAGSLPHPLSLIQAFLGYGLLNRRERLSVLSLAARLRLRPPASTDDLDAVNALQWLTALGQGRETVDMLWRPLVLATLNAEPEECSAALLVTVLREVFLGPAAHTVPLLPATGLSDLFARPALRLLREAGAEIRLHTPAASLSLEAGRCTGILCHDGSRIDGEVVLAVSPWDARSLLHRSGVHDLLGIPFERFLPSTILSAHVWTRRPLSDEPMLGLLGTGVQWLFAHGRDAEGWRCSLTMSAANTPDLSAMDVVRQRIFNELRALFPPLSEHEIVRFRLIRERRATFIPAPGLARVRPAARTTLPGLTLAGDWTATGLPATIEGAVRSGETAAEVVMSRAIA